MSDHLIFPSKVMEHLDIAQVELVYERYLNRQVTKELLSELGVKCHVGHIISHFPLVEAETNFKCGVCDSEIFTRRNNTGGVGVDWGRCKECSHTQLLEDGFAVRTCSCFHCEENRMLEQAAKQEQYNNKQATFWKKFQNLYTYPVDQYCELEGISSLDVYITSLLINSGLVSSDGTFGPIERIQSDHLVFPSLSDFIKYINRMFKLNAITYEWSELTKETILQVHSSESDLDEFIELGEHWVEYEKVHLKFTISKILGEHQCVPLSEGNDCEENGRKEKGELTTHEIQDKLGLYVAAPGDDCILGQNAVWESIHEIQLMQLKEFIKIIEVSHDFTIVESELPSIKEVIISALAKYSPSQCAYLISKAIKDAIVFSRSGNCKGRVHACRTIRNTISRLMEKAVAEGWELSKYRRPKYSVIPKLAQNFFSEILGYTDDNDPAWYLSVNDIKEKFTGTSQQTGFNPDSEFLPLLESGESKAVSLPKFTCVKCNTKGHMDILTLQTQRLVLRCKECNTAFRYKFFDSVVIESPQKGHTPSES